MCLLVGIIGKTVKLLFKKVLGIVSKINIRVAQSHDLTSLVNFNQLMAFETEQKKLKNEAKLERLILDLAEAKKNKTDKIS